MAKSQYKELLDFNRELMDFLHLNFERIDEKFKQIDSRFDVLEKDMTQVKNNADFVLGELKLLNEEKTVGAYRSSRMETWIQKAAKKIDLPYAP